MHEEPEGEPRPFECGGCGMRLPIAVERTPDAVRIVCSFCGSRYLGKVWPEVPDNLKGNIRIIKD